MVNNFIELCNRSIQAGYLIFAIVLLRLVWKRVPKLMYRFLWCLVGLRLALPFTLETALSLIPKKTVIEPEILYAKTPAVDSGIPTVNQVVNPMMAENFTPAVGASGAIFGITGALLWVTTRNRGGDKKLTVLKMIFLIVYSLYNGFISTNVDNAAHIGGLIGGFVLAIILYRKKRGKME